jgi:lipopolysaccharide/colanic/teichoic acid biosynthesis glycosyltransferase
MSEGRAAAGVLTRPGLRDQDAIPVPDGFAKRLLDIVVASLLLLLLAPLLAVLALVIKLETPGPVLYRARRVGLRGREFLMLKLRKMHEGAGGGPLTMADDERFTRVGRILARYKLDEIPQLWNVLRGEMSLVGPRPEDPRFVQQRPELFRDILLVRPGITGVAQLAFRSESELLDATDPAADYASRVLPEKLELDRLYIRNQRIRIDLAVLWWTFVAVVLRRPVLMFGDCKNCGRQEFPSRQRRK